MIGNSLHISIIERVIFVLSDLCCFFCICELLTARVTHPKSNMSRFMTPWCLTSDDTWCIFINQPYTMSCLIATASLWPGSVACRQLVFARVNCNPMAVSSSSNVAWTAAETDHCLDEALVWICDIPHVLTRASCDVMCTYTSLSVTFLLWKYVQSYQRYIFITGHFAFMPSTDKWQSEYCLVRVCARSENVA